jgi:opacity protein-like surface antigen
LKAKINVKSLYIFVIERRKGIKLMSYSRNKRHKSRAGMKTLSKLAFIIFLLFVIVASMPASAAAEEKAQEDGWQFGASGYMWMSNIGGKTASGDTYELTFDDLMKDLDFTYMGGLEARKGRWHITTDIIYLNLDQENDGKVTLPRGNGLKVDATVKLQSWVITPAIGYTFIQTENISMEFLAGARYLWVEPELELDVTGPLHSRDRNISDSADFWNGIVGIRGELNLDRNWYVPYYVDIGTGDTDLTWQWLAGLGVRVSKAVDVVAAWRYLYWKFDDNKVLDKMYISGPGVGVKFRF